MELNSIIFPAPKCSYTKESRNIIWIESNAINTPVFHHQNIQNESEQENKENVSKPKQVSGPFSLCIGSTIDQDTEIEVQQQQQQKQQYHHANRSYSYQQGDSRKGIQVQSSLCERNVFGESQQNYFPQSQESMNSKKEYLNNVDQINSQTQIKKDIKAQEMQQLYNLHSPIRSSKKCTSLKGLDASSSCALKKAAELGPSLKNAIKTSIPCLYLPYFEGSDKLIIYFHGNAEDLGYSYDFVSNLRRYLRANLLAVEYPGYGLYTGSPNSDQILQDADSVYEFVRTHLKVQSQNIIIFGRSIGSGPACYLAGTRNIGGLILMCPYTSIRNVVKHLAGSLMQYLVAERFRNIDYIKHSKCPTLFIHGKMDKLIPYQHSLDLMECVKDRALIHLSPSMTHNEFSIAHDLITPIKTFFSQAKIVVSKQKIHIPSQFYYHPNDEQKLSKTTSVASITARVM